MMAKAWAKILVYHNMTRKGWRLQLRTGDGWWAILLVEGQSATDDSRLYTLREALARARAWSRRLGGIPVEVEE